MDKPELRPSGPCPRCGFEWRDCPCGKVDIVTGEPSRPCDGDLPVSIARGIVEKYGQRQVIVFAWDGNRQHVVTYGWDAHDSDLAAQGGNVLKKALGWPNPLSAVSPRVTALLDALRPLANKKTSAESEGSWPDGDAEILAARAAIAKAENR